MSLFKTIIFDLDGTIFKTDAFIKTCQKRNINSITKAKVLELIGEPTSIICQKIFGDIKEEEIETIRQEIKVYQDEVFYKKSKLYDGIIELLKKLNDDEYTLCMCTNVTTKFLKHFNISQYFKTIKRYTKGFTKKEMIEQILDEYHTSNAIVIGDSLSDIKAVLETSCLSIGISYGNDDVQLADFKCDKPLDIYWIINKINTIYQRIYLEILNKKQHDKPLIVGINGVDTSGKTMFTKEFNRFLQKMRIKTQMIHMDDFHHPSIIRYKGKDPITSYIDNAFDLDKLVDEILKPITNNHQLDKEIKLLDMEKDQLTIKKRYRIDKDTIVLIEGVLLYREPIYQYFDYRIFIDITFDEVLIRAKRRDHHIFGDAVLNRYINKYIPIQKMYLKKYKPKAISDIIINNENYMQPNIVD